VGDLVLRTRIDTAQRNLERVSALEHVVARGQRTFDDLTGSIDEMIGKTKDTLKRLGDVNNDVNELADAGPDFTGFDGNGLVQEIRKLVTGLGQAAQQLRNARDELIGSLNNAKKNRVALLQAQLQFNDLGMLSIRANELAGKLAKLDKASYWATPPTGQRPLPEECDGLFDEYVDLLRGMALREVGYGDDEVDIGHVFAIADQMPRLWAPVGGWAWSSLALPSRMEQNALTSSGVLRIGFPEWTIWALPLVQHDFGRMFVNRCTPNAVDEGLLADACATIVTGPAYACAALLLRLDPQQVKAGAPETETLRSATIIRALSEVASNATDKVLVELTKRLNDEWRDAVSAAGAQPELFDQAIGSRVVEVAVKRAAEMLSDTSTVENAGPPWATSWASVTTIARQLKAGKATEIDLPAPGDGGRKPVALTFLLNAAWFARIGSAPDEEAQASEITVIAKGTLNQLRGLPSPKLTAPQQQGGIFNFGGGS
jgi:hypothetical protein